MSGRLPPPPILATWIVRTTETRSATPLLFCSRGSFFILRSRFFPKGEFRNYFLIIPIFKGKGKAKEKPSSYRPVALTSCTAKLAERLVATRLVYHLELKKKLAPCQAGFRRDRSTEEQLARVTQDIFDGLEAKEPRRAALVLLDFSRAYDKTWKAALYVKLKDLEVPTCMIRWIKGFLADRRARVRWNDTLSKERVFREGLPQGSVLAPALWLCYCNDIWQTVHDRAPDCGLSLFADDTALVASDRELKKCATKLQPALDAVTEWCSRWKVQLAQYEDAAESKCCYTVHARSSGEQQ